LIVVPGMTVPPVVAAVAAAAVWMDAELVPDAVLVVWERVAVPVGVGLEDAALVGAELVPRHSLALDHHRTMAVVLDQVVDAVVVHDPAGVVLAVYLLV